MDRNAIIAEMRRWQSDYNAYNQKITQAESDIEQLEYLNQKLKAQLNNFQGYIQKRVDRINQFDYLAQTSSIAREFLRGMSSRVNSVEVRNAVGNLSGSVNEVSNKVKNLKADIASYKANMDKCAQNYSYWKRQLQLYDQQNSANN